MEYGRPLEPTSPFGWRGGLYNSLLSVGGDYKLFGNPTLSFDVYNPNYYILDARSIWMLNKDVGVLVGVENATKAAGISVGVELRH